MKPNTLETSFNPDQWLNLADASIGACAISVTDDWFAEVSRMLQPTEPEWREGVYDDNGKWMDGWESRRKRGPGHDHAVIRLGTTGTLSALEIDTRYFTGNYPPSASVEACLCENGDPGDNTVWTEILPSVALQGDHCHLFQLETEQTWSHLRLNIYPDGGIARFRAYGTASCDWDNVSGQQIDLAAALNGARAVLCSDQHYGTMGNILKPGRGINMGDGWETARRRVPGYDWVIIELAHPGTISEVIVDTLHFKGNYPDSCSIQGAFVSGGADSQLAAQSLYWEELLPSQKLSMDQEHAFKEQVKAHEAITHIKLNIFPDGGISRIRLLGHTG